MSSSVSKTTLQDGTDVEPLAPTVPMPASGRRGPSAWYRTAHTEYYLDNGTCTRVVDRATGKEFQRHAALGARLDGSMAPGSTGAREPRVGDTLILTTVHKHVMLTSSLTEIQFPA